MAWKYYGRTSGVKVYEIYRAPDNGQRIGDQEHNLVERLQANGEWRSDSNDRGIWNELLSGWFDDNDELTEDQVMQLVEEWKVQGWPWRP